MTFFFNKKWQLLFNTLVFMKKNQDLYTQDMLFDVMHDLLSSLVMMSGFLQAG